MLTLDIADADTMRRDIAARIEAQDFPCVGAKSALARGTLEIVRCSDIRSAWDDLVIHRRLLEWFYYEKEKQAANRMEMATDHDFYDNLQWDPEDAAEVRDRGQMPLVYNEVAPMVD